MSQDSEPRLELPGLNFPLDKFNAMSQLARQRAQEELPELADDLVESIFLNIDDPEIAHDPTKRREVILEIACKALEQSFGEGVTAMQVELLPLCSAEGVTTNVVLPGSLLADDNEIFRRAQLNGGVFEYDD